MKKIIYSIVLFAVPVVMFAQTLLNTTTLVSSFGGLVSIMIPITAALALLYFFWGLAKFILAQGNEEQKNEGKSIMVWGTIALFVMVSIWGITTFIANDLGVSGTYTPSAPTIGV